MPEETKSKLAEKYEKATKFSQEDLDEIKEIQKSYIGIQQAFGQMEMNKLRLITYILRWVLAIVVFVVSSISISYDTQLRDSGIWIAIFCLSILNIVDMSERKV